MKAEEVAFGKRKLILEIGAGMEPQAKDIPLPPPCNELSILEIEVNEEGDHDIIA